MNSITQETINRFWSNVDKSGGKNSCWIWLLSRTHNGYGQVGWGGKVYRTNRVAYELTKGAIPENMEVCHSCDNPSCCNPLHLFLGTRSDNMIDMYKKGRRIISYGESHPSHKLTDLQVYEIRRLYSLGGQSYRKLAKIFGCSYSQIDVIVNYEQRNKP